MRIAPRDILPEEARVLGNQPNMNNALKINCMSIPTWSINLQQMQLLHYKFSKRLQYCEILFSSRITEKLNQITRWKLTAVFGPHLSATQVTINLQRR
jgi:hypothetical protein